ncbi:MAG: WXG100 family type VII secretion target [Defluviitaleaceae bacterium]|nr:WXG100 family type VII secretion target [Defluviitaleaceae bacterium]MCL2262408.1 WXG100 family type VII secretion target [Defluviitaleaceae bacterium]
MSDFKLDTCNMKTVANQVKQLHNRMMNLRAELDAATNDLIGSWVGLGRNEFEFQYQILNRQFTDIIDDTWNMCEKITDAEESYIQADISAASSRGV